MLPQSGILLSFSALKLLVGQQEGHLAFKSVVTTVPKSLLLGTGLTWSNLTPSTSNSGKVGQFNKYRVHVMINSLGGFQQDLI